MRNRLNTWRVICPWSTLCRLDAAGFAYHLQCGVLQGDIKCELLDAKHESHLLHLDGQLSYDPKPYGVDHATRFHIKTMQVSPQWSCVQYLHHLVMQEYAALAMQCLYPVVFLTCLSVPACFLCLQHCTISCHFTAGAVVTIVSKSYPQASNFLQCEALLEPFSLMQTRCFQICCMLNLFIIYL